MSVIKETIEKLAREWSWEVVSTHPTRSALLRHPKLIGKGNGISVLVDQGATWETWIKEFTFRHERANGDLRIWTKVTNGLIQWRTDPVKGSRLVYRPFGTATQTERLDIEEIFLDPTNVEEDEVQMFEMLYADVAPHIADFYVALQKADDILIDFKKENKWQ